MKTKLLYITILSILLIPACKQDPSSYCPGYSTNYQTLIASAINQTPYFNNEAFNTLSFASDKGDTVTFVKTKTDSSWYCEDDYSNANCPKKNANCYQIIHNTYKTIKGIGSFDVKIFLYNELGYNILQIVFNNDSYKVDYNLIGDKNTIGYRQKLLFNNRIFFDVLEIDSTFSKSNIYLNKGQGLFRMEYFFSNINWTKL
jgi:hypothetical protein